MSRQAQIVELARWLQTPPGRYLLQWEQARLDEAVADLFGFHALQLGLPELQGLRGNRMPFRWLALDSSEQQLEVAPSGLSEEGGAVAAPATGQDWQDLALRCGFDALPFDAASLDLLVLPHALELAEDPHHTLREVERVLRPEGRVVVTGLNPASLWGLRQNLGRLRQGIKASDAGLFLPRAGEFIGYWRLRDWLRLLGFEVETVHFGCYKPPLRSDKWLQRWNWLEPTGARWWTVLGAVYFIVAVKRVHGMRMIGLAKRQRAAASAGPAVAAHQQHRQSDS